MYFITWVEYGFEGWGNKNILRLYMWMPLILLPFAKLLKTPYGKLCDFFAPGLTLTSLFGHIGCPFPGCCYGYPCAWGIYNPELHERVFPIQWVDCFASLLIFLYIEYYLKKNDYDCQGKTLAFFLIFFGGFRFVSQFFRDVPRLFWGISELGVCAIFTLAAGLVMLRIISRARASADRDAERT